MTIHRQITIPNYTMMTWKPPARLVCMSAHWWTGKEKNHITMRNWRLSYWRFSHLQRSVQEDEVEEHSFHVWLVQQRRNMLSRWRHVYFPEKIDNASYPDTVVHRFFETSLEAMNAVQSKEATKVPYQYWPDWMATAFSVFVGTDIGILTYCACRLILSAMGHH